MFGLKVLVVGDAHFRPGESHEDFDRAYAVGGFVLDHRPDVVVQIGDLVDFESIDGWRGARSIGGAGSGKSHEGKRLKDDLALFKAAQRAIMAPVRRTNERHVRGKHRERIYEPRWIQLLGNHEDRLDRVAEHQPELDGLIGTHQLHKISEENGWECYRYREEVRIGGVSFSHLFSTGTSSRPVGVRQALGKLHRSAVWGHTHVFGFDQQPAGDGTISAVCVGTYKPPHRCGPFEWSGLVMLNNVRDGSFEISQHSYDEVLEAHGQGGYAQQLRGSRAQAARDLEDAEGAW